ncbi:MAG: hypothetical protein ACI9V1_000588 [Spirosomataceae bacterium]|jgi:hypothetical protein
MTLRDWIRILLDSQSDRGDEYYSKSERSILQIL